MLTKKKIDAAIKKYDLEIILDRKNRYCYFLSLKAGGRGGEQIGESIMGCVFNDLTLENWIKEANKANETRV